MLLFSEYTSEFLLYWSIIIIPFCVITQRSDNFTKELICSHHTLFPYSVVGRMAPHHIPNLIPESCKYATFHGKRDFIEVLKVMDFMIWRSSCIILPGWTQSNHISPQNKTFSGWSRRDVAERKVKELRSIRGALCVFTILKMRELCKQACRYPLGAERSLWVTASR